MYYQRNTKENGTDYYKLLLVYVEDVLACSHNAKAVMAVIAKTFDINNDEIAEPKLYFGGNVENFQLPNGSMYGASLLTHMCKVLHILYKGF